MKIGIPQESPSFRATFASFKEKIARVPIRIWLFIVVLIITIITVALYIFLSPSLRQKLFPESSPAPEAENIWTPKKPVSPPLASGKQIYAISGGKKGAPYMTQAAIDPIDPSSGESQTLTVKANDSKPITQITATMITDNKSETHTLRRVEGTETDGVWQGSWKIDSSFDYKYQVELEAKNADLANKVVLTFR